MNNKVFCSSTALLFSIFLLSSCLTAEPPQLSLVTESSDYAIEGSRIFPESVPAMEQGIYYSVPAGAASNSQDAFLTIDCPAGFSGNINLYLKSGELLTFTPGEGAGERSRAIPLPSFTMRELSGIGLKETTKESMPRMGVEHQRILVTAGKKTGLSGIKIESPEQGMWKVLIDPSVLSPEITDKPWYLKLNYRQALNTSNTTTEYQESPSLTINTETEGEAYDFFPKTGENSLYFYSERFRVLPEEIAITGVGGFSIESLELNLRRDEEGKTIPLIADTGTILHYPRENWRNTHYEYFRWNLHPEIIQIISDSYTTQSLFFKRLAFYVEKPGFVGRLAPNSEIEPLHGWNAHDYRPSDLAAFFQQASEEDFALNEEEELLRNILLETGVILETEGRLIPGKGALVGTSIETFYEQRLIFMAHESIHGIYFTSETYRKECEAFWESLSPDEQKFWINFLSYRGYNVDEDRDLLINETTTYLLQQPAWQSDDYFVGFITPRLLGSRKHLKDWLVPVLLENSGLFEKLGKDMEARLEREAGFKAETIHDLLPKDRSTWFIFEGMEEKWLAQQGIDQEI